MDKKQVKIIYKNWKGVIAKRNILPEKLFYGSDEWHKVEQWFVLAYDLDKKANRNFALNDILKWGH